MVLLLVIDAGNDYFGYDHEQEHGHKKESTGHSGHLIQPSSAA